MGGFKTKTVAILGGVEEALEDVILGTGCYLLQKTMSGVELGIGCRSFRLWVGRSGPVSWRKLMHCYECLQAGVTRDAIGLCHHCSAALCTEHAFVVADPVTTIYPLMKTVVLPKRARLLLCGTCKAALEQTRSDEFSFA
jgi:hypothetical protein